MKLAERIRKSEKPTILSPSKSPSCLEALFYGKGALKILFFGLFLVLFIEGFEGKLEFFVEVEGGAEFFFLGAKREELAIEVANLIIFSVYSFITSLIITGHFFNGFG